MRHEMNDNFGNKLILESGKPYKIYLNLKGKKPKVIAQWDAETKTLFVKRNSERHYHYKTKSYGFNKDLMDNLEIEKVNIKIDRDFYLVPIQEFAFARHLNFSQQGFELQKFLPIENIRKYEMPSL
jgi:hypothetical protein